MANKKANVQDKYIHTYITLNLNIFINSFNNSNGQQCSLKKELKKHRLFLHSALKRMHRKYELG